MTRHESVVLYASAARTAAFTGTDQTNLGHVGLHLIIDVTSVTATPGITPTIQGKDANGVYYDVLVGSAITATGTNVLKLFPGASPVANAVANDYLPNVWRLKMAVADSDSATYSVAALLLPLGG